MFSFFITFWKIEKMTQTMNKNTIRKQLARNDPRNSPKLAKNHEISTLEAPQISKIAKETTYLRAWFFDDFWHAKKMQKKREKWLDRRIIRSARRNVRAAWEDYRRVLERLQGRKEEAGGFEKEGWSSTPHPGGAADRFAHSAWPYPLGCGWLGRLLCPCCLFILPTQSINQVNQEPNQLSNPTNQANQPTQPTNQPSNVGNQRKDSKSTIFFSQNEALRNS